MIAEQRPIYLTIKNAYAKAKSRNWDTMYWMIDIHETLIHSSYNGSGVLLWLPGAFEMITDILRFPENKIILWSSMQSLDAGDGKMSLQTFRAEIIRKTSHRLEAENRIFLNGNPEVENTSYADFSIKPYFNILLDDKAGFDYHWDIAAVKSAVYDFGGTLTIEQGN